MQHCRLLFESLCRSVKPFLLFLEILGHCAFPGVQGCCPFPMQDPVPATAAAVWAGWRCSSTWVWNRHQAVRLPGLCKSFLCALHCLMNSMESNQPKTTPSIATYRIFPYVTEPSHWNILCIKVLTDFNPEFFSSIKMCIHSLSTTEDQWDRMSSGALYKSPA